MSRLLIETCDAHEKFPWQGFGVRHDLSGHALFTMPRLMELARALPAQQVEYNAGELPVDQDPQKTPRNGLSIEETIQRIATCRSWMVLKNVEQQPEYRRLLDEMLDEHEACYRQAGLLHCGDREAFIFISSPGSVTPFHIDPEHNFLLQVSGEKTMRQWNWRDRSILSDESIEGTYRGRYVHRNLKYRDEFDAKATAFTLRPGDGVYVPVHAPHWVKNGDQVSVSFSITFRSDYSRRNARLYHGNARVRRMGLQPVPVGKYPRYDVIKDSVYRAVARLERLFKRAPD